MCVILALTLIYVMFVNVVSAMLWWVEYLHRLYFCPAGQTIVGFVCVVMSHRKRTFYLYATNSLTKHITKYRPTAYNFCNFNELIRNCFCSYVWVATVNLVNYFKF